MGLASALSTALTGLSGAETTIDVVGNNLANSNTIGFKASDAAFATQFLQTQSLGSAPTDNSGGTNPRQIGLGTMVAAIMPNFNQGTIQVSSNPTDLAIQGDGFFIVQGANGNQLYSRNGMFKLNGDNNMVTMTGNNLLGFGVNNQFQIDSTTLRPINIPLGSATVAKATSAVVMEGTLTPTGDIANQSQIVQSGILTDGKYTYPLTGVTTALGGAGILSGKYQYYITFANGNLESRPSPVDETPPLNNNQVTVSGLDTDASGQWTTRRIYRTVNDPPGDNSLYMIAEINNVNDATATYTDNNSDAAIIAGNHKMSMYGPPVTSGSMLKDVISFDGTTYNQVFPDNGTLHFTGRKGGRSLATKDFTVTATSTVKDLASFMEQALGIQQSPGLDPANPIPIDSVTGLPPGSNITADGRLRLVSNTGVDAAIDVGLSGLQMTTDDIPPEQTSISLPFTNSQVAKGQSTVADMIAYDSLGMPLQVRVTAVLEERTSTYTAYRWMADCANNDPATGAAIAVGTGVIKFDGVGNFISASSNTVSIERAHEPSVKPQQFTLDFTQISGLANDKATLAVSRQDGSAPGVLNSFIVGEDGLIRGVFSNGITRDLGQIRLARFANAAGLEQIGENMYAPGVNSGLPIQANPSEQGNGRIVAGAVELSNTDIGGNLIDLVLSSTMYRANSRVITTVQQMLDELLALRR